MKATIVIDIPTFNTCGFITITANSDCDHIDNKTIDNLLVHVCNKMKVDRIVTDDYYDGEVINGVRTWKVGIAPKL